MDWKPEGKLGFLTQIFADPAPYESDERRQAFEEDLDAARPEDEQSYTRVCSKYALTGTEIPPEHVPPYLTRASDTEHIRREIEKHFAPVDYPQAEVHIDRLVRFSGPREAVHWQPADGLLGGSRDFSLANPKRESIFATCRPGDDVSEGQPDIGLAHESVEEAQAGVEGGVGERINHRLALDYTSAREMVVYVYPADWYTNLRAPVPPDADTHRYFRPVPPSPQTFFGRTRPELQSPCPKCPNCAEDELVHEKKSIPTDILWVALIKAEKKR